MNSIIITFARLSDATEKGHLGTLKQLINDGADIALNSDWLLCLASSSGQLKIVKYLIEEQKADPYTLGRAPLRNAIEHDYLDIVKYFIEEKHVSIDDFSKEIMECTGRSGSIEMVDYFAYQQNIFPLSDGGCVLIEAICREHIDLTKHLITKYNALTKLNQHEALNVASFHRQSDIIDLLIENGADISSIKETFPKTYMPIKSAQQNQIHTQHLKALEHHPVAKTPKRRLLKTRILKPL